MVKDFSIFINEELLWRKKKKYSLDPLHAEDDPYGEEDWEDDCKLIESLYRIRIEGKYLKFTKHFAIDKIFLKVVDKYIFIGTKHYESARSIQRFYPSKRFLLGKYKMYNNMDEAEKNYYQNIWDYDYVGHHHQMSKQEYDRFRELISREFLDKLKNMIK